MYCLLGVILPATAGLSYTQGMFCSSRISSTAVFLFPYLFLLLSDRKIIALVYSTCQKKTRLTFRKFPQNAFAAQLCHKSEGFF